MEKRNRYLIDPKFQLGFMKKAITAALAVIFVLFAANWYFFWKFRTLGLALQLPPEHVYFQFIQRQMTMMGVIFLVTALVVLLVIVMGGLILSNRIAGPIYRICTSVQEMNRTGVVS